MSSATIRRPRLVWPWVLLGLVLLGAANGHLVYVALTSQPDCVAHVRPGEGDPQRGVFGAARSSCTPQAAGGRAS
jgi:hypothetical protein